MILDTNAVSAILQGDNGILHILRTVPMFMLPTPVIGEYRFGLLGSRLRRQLEIDLHGLIG